MDNTAQIIKDVITAQLMKDLPDQVNKIAETWLNEEVDVYGGKPSYEYKAVGKRGEHLMGVYLRQLTSEAWREVKDELMPPLKEKIKRLLSEQIFGHDDIHLVSALSNLFCDMDIDLKLDCKQRKPY